MGTEYKYVFSIAMCLACLCFCRGDGSPDHEQILCLNSSIGWPLVVKMDGRREYVDRMAKEYKADGIIYQQMKFCDPWAYEKMMGSHILRSRYGHPVLSVDRPYAIGSSGQMRTRVQAFMESIDIKKIQKEGN